MNSLLKMIKYLFSIIIFLNLSCAQNTPIDKFINDKGVLVMRKYFPNKKLLAEGTFINDSIKHGYYKEYYENGNIKLEQQYFYGKLNGIEKFYYESGNLKHIGSLKDGIKDSIWLIYYENGSIEKKNNYKKNQLFGEQLRYYENGKLKEYLFGDINGVQRYKRTYDEKGLFLNEEGDYIPMYISDASNLKIGDTLKVEIYVVTPFDLKVELYSRVVEGDGNTNWESVLINGNLGLYKYIFVKEGDYHMQTKLHLKNLQTGTEKEIKENATRLIVAKK